MNNLFKLVLLAGILSFSGCGKEQSGQEPSASTAPTVQTAPTSPTETTAPEMKAPAEPATVNMESGMEKMEKPAWARLEQNVYHYPR